MSNCKGGADTICPFYIKEARLSISCEGIIHGSSMMLRFKDESNKERWQSIACETYKYMGCPLAALVCKKY